MEVYGVSKADSVNKPSWSFQVDGLEWQSFTVINVNYYMEEPQIEGDTVIWFGEYTTS